MGIFALFCGWNFQEVETFDKFCRIYFYELVANLQKFLMKTLSTKISYRENFSLKACIHSHMYEGTFEPYSNSSWSVFNGQLVFVFTVVVFKGIVQVCVCLVKGKYTVLQSNYIFEFHNSSRVHINFQSYSQI